MSSTSNLFLGVGFCSVESAVGSACLLWMAFVAAVLGWASERLRCSARDELHSLGGLAVACYVQLSLLAALRDAAFEHRFLVSFHLSSLSWPPCVLEDRVCFSPVGCLSLPALTPASSHSSATPSYSCVTETMAYRPVPVYDLCFAHLGQKQTEIESQSLEAQS